MKHTPGLYTFFECEREERQRMENLWYRLIGVEWTNAKLKRYKCKLAEWYSMGIYDHMKALDLIFYATDKARKTLFTEKERPRVYTAWQLSRAIVRDLETRFFKMDKRTINQFREMEVEEENKVFSDWLEENYISVLTKTQTEGIMNYEGTKTI